MITPNDNVNLHERFNVSGHIAFVSGSARGIGRAIAIALAEYGATVVVHGSRQSQSLTSALEAVRKYSPKSIAIAEDLSDKNAAENILTKIKNQLGSLPDIVVANASLQAKKAWTEFTSEDMHEHIQVNFNATLALMQGCFESMKAKQWGRIVTIGSVQELRPHPEMPIYAASKSAQENLVRNIARQIAKFGITVNNIAPGVFYTDRNQEALGNPEYAQKVTAAIPSHTYAEPADIAGSALLLCSDAGKYITGATIVVDGGLCLPGQ